MMQVLIVDDEPLARNELTYLLNKYDDSLTIETAEDMTSALALLLRQPFDVVFLDIHLQDESGLTLATHVNHMTNPPIIIFATAYDQYAVQAFEQNARDYLLKPYEADRLKQAMDKAQQSIFAQQEANAGEARQETYPISQDDRIYMVPAKEIITIEAQQGLLLIHTVKKNYETHGSLSDWLEKLPRDNFRRVHRSYLINLDKVTVVEPWFNQTLSLTLAGGIKVPVSRANVNQVKKDLGIHS
nr:LytTR family transcriptional regulator DNA-binding domain-containing protein [Streptococcus henryi]